MADQVLVAPPGITRPDQFAQDNIRPMPPRAGNSLIVGGPAYFTPEGYQAPIQPEQSFMPTGGRPNLIQDSFNRQLPPIQRPQPQMPAPTPAPVQAPVPTQTGGVGDPAPYVPPYVPPEPVTEPVMPPPLPEGYEYDQDGNIVLINEPTPEPVFTPPPTMQEPNGFFPGVTPDFSNLDFSGLSDLSLEDMDFSNLPGMMPPPVSPPAAATMPAPAQAPAPVYTPPPSQVPMQDMMDDYDFGNPNLRNMRGFDPRR